MVTVLVVVDTELYRGILTAILGREHGVRVFGTSGSCEEVVELFHGVRADVLLVDMSMPECLTTISAIRQIDRSVSVVAFALREIDEEVLGYVESAGLAWVPPSASLGQLLDSVHHAAGGKLVSWPRSLSQ